MAAHQRETRQREELLAAAELGTLAAAARQVGVSMRSVVRWRRQDASLRAELDDALDGCWDAALSQMMAAAAADELDLDRVRAWNMVASQASRGGALRATSRRTNRPELPVPFVPGGG